MRGLGENGVSAPHRLKNAGGEFGLRQRRGRKRMINKLPGISKKMKGTKLYARDKGGELV